MIYLDYNATTPVLSQVREAMLPYLTSEWGNPSSPYLHGGRAKSAMDTARSQVARLVGSNESEVIFTSCATEANNTAIHSAISATPGKKHIITSKVEHSSVLHYYESLSKNGYDVTFLPTSVEGVLDLEDLEKSIRSDTALVSLMWANNETGVIFPVREIAEICAHRGIPFHCDAVQAAGKVPIAFSSIPFSFLTLSGHKIGAPKGVGALVVHSDVQFHPLILGGKQESGRRGGTECVPLIVAFGAASDIAVRQEPNAWDRVALMRDDLERRLLAEIPGAYGNGCLAERLPNTLNFGIEGIDSDSLVTYCDANGVCVSSGSACMESAITPSHVLLAMTGQFDRATQAIRVSLGLETKLDDLNVFSKLAKSFVSLNQ